MADILDSHLQMEGASSTPSVYCRRTTYNIQHSIHIAYIVTTLSIIMKLTSSGTVVVALASLMSHAVVAFAPPRAPQCTARTTTTALTETSRRDWWSQASVSLLGFSMLLPHVAAHAEPRPAYLTEPTEEFKANEAKAAEFRNQQRAIRERFNVVIDRLSTVSQTEEELIQDLKELTDYVYRTGGLPTGIKKEDLFKTIRRKKAAGFWPTNVEIA